MDSCLHFYLYLFTETVTHFIRLLHFVLYLRATTGYRHDSIPDSISALQARAGMDGVDFEFTEDPTRFNGDELGRFDGVMFLSTTGEGGEFEKKNIILVELIAELKTTFACFFFSETNCRKALTGFGGALKYCLCAKNENQSITNYLTK
jgi:hypothetical protein